MPGCGVSVWGEEGGQTGRQHQQEDRVPTGGGHSELDISMVEIGHAKIYLLRLECGAQKKKKSKWYLYSLFGYLRERGKAVPDNVPQVEPSRGANHTAQYVYLEEGGLV